MMKWKQTESSITIKTPAKLNLFLEVLGKRDDGFHALQTVIIPVDRYDTLSITKSDGEGIQLDCQWDAQLCSNESLPPESVFGDLPNGPQNLVFRAAELFRQRCQIETGLDIELVKSIPSQAGLGGASGNAAGTLVALNELFETNLPRGTLIKWAAELGSDIPFFVGDGTAICEGRGEIVKPLSRDDELDLVVVKPEFGLSTPDIFSRLEISDTRVALPQGLEQAERIDWSKSLFNRLQEAAEKVQPEIRKICNRLVDMGCKASLMTGSGSCCFGICESQATAREIADAYAKANSGFVFTCRNLANFSVRE